MARFTETITAQTLPALITAVNTFLATLTDPTIRYFEFLAQRPQKRTGTNFLFSVSYEDGGAALATDFTFNVLQQPNAADLDTEIAAEYASTPAAFFTGIRLARLDQDDTRLETFFAAYLTNATGGASANYLPQ